MNKSTKKRAEGIAPGIAPDFGTPFLNQSRQGAPKGAYGKYVTFGATPKADQKTNKMLTSCKRDGGFIYFRGP